MKVLFLDVDGVLTRGSMGPENIAAELVARVVSVIRRTGCVVVLSSTHRIGRRYNELRRALIHRHGDPFRFHDRTPDCAQKVGALYIGSERGAEIREWLDNHPEVTRFAIVDDTDDMGPLSERLVQTQWSFGIQEDDVEELVKLLGEKESSA